MSQSPFSVYIHVPFCAHKCPYCDFNTYAVARIPEAEYVAAVCSEISGFSRDPRFHGRNVATVFFGGGTPSLLAEGSIDAILQCIHQTFSIAESAEITLEANPNDAESVKLGGFKAAGVNRISFGVQSFEDVRLRMLGRNHSAEEAVRAIERAVEVGIADVSLDIIFGTPDQTVEDLERDVRRALSLPIRHLSTYSLTIEPGTPFFQRQARGLLVMPPDERVVVMLEKIPLIVGDAGFKQYEISNYALPGSESRHNTVYWSGGDYLGVGAGAHSYCAQYDSLGRIEMAERWSNLALPQSYINVEEGNGRVSWRETLGREALQFEFFYLGMRRTEIGVSRREFQKLFGEPFPAGITRILEELRGEGYLQFQGDAILLTTRGLAIADSVFERLAQ